MASLETSLAIIEFDPGGIILRANPNFCKLMGYDSAEIVGQKHAIFVEPGFDGSSEYRSFWGALRGGEFISDEFRHVGKGGREVFVKANYTPVFNRRKRVTKIVKLASDITSLKRRQLDEHARLRAIDRAQAIIEFTVDGNILSANVNFLSALGYGLDEVVGKHHRMFVDPSYATSPAYVEMWERLAAGEFVADEFRRIGKDGKEVFIQASYDLPPLTGPV